MTVLDDMLPPPVDAARSNLNQLIEVASQRISMLDVAELARLGAHEYDEDAAVPPPGSPGAQFLTAVARDYIRWLNREGRFPAEDEAGEVVTRWHREAPGGDLAYAYADLGLVYSYHRDAAGGAGIADFQQVLDQVAERAIITLTSEYGPLV